MTAVDPQEKRPLRWLRIAVVVIAGILTLAVVANAIGYLVPLVQGDPGAAVWALLIISAVFPFITFLIALLIGAKRSIVELAIVLLAGVGLAMVFWMNTLLYALVPIFG